MASTVLLIPHMDAGDRGQWEGDQDLRPLTELGQRQATALAAALSALPITGLFASPALRARQTLEPLALNLSLEILAEPGLAEKRLGEDRGAVTERGKLALQRIAASHELAAAASHGDLIPWVADHITRGNAPELTRRGQWYVIEMTEPPTVRVEPEAGAFPL